jgi:hypothetical protein
MASKRQRRPHQLAFGERFMWQDDDELRMSPRGRSMSPCCARRIAYGRMAR